MFPLVRSRWFLSLAFAATLGAVGCNQNLEQNAAFQEQVSRLDRLEDDLKKASRQVSSLDAEFQPVSKDVAQLVANGKIGGAGGAGSADAIKALEARIATLEKRLNESGKAAPHLVTADPAAEEPAPAVDTGQAAAATPPTPASKKKHARASLQAQDASGAPLAVVGKAARRKKGHKIVADEAGAEAAPAGEVGAAPGSPRRSPGGYHAVAPGETIQQLAAKNGVLPSAIISANHLPANSVILPGQTIFIPGAK